MPNMDDHLEIRDSDESMEKTAGDLLPNDSNQNH